MTEKKLLFDTLLKSGKKKVYDSLPQELSEKFLLNLENTIQTLLPVKPVGYWDVKQQIEVLQKELPGNTLAEKMLFIKALMFELIDYQIKNNFYIVHSKKLYSQAIDRFTFIIEDNLRHDTEYYTVLSDTFVKDFALCTGKLISTGLLVFDITKIPKSFIFKHILRLPYFLKMNMFKNFIEAHLDDNSRKVFNAENWENCYVLATEMLRLSPELQGVFGRCWFYDPVLANQITPKLKFASAIQVDNGAALFPSKQLQSDITLSTLRSKTRQDLYRKGLYKPRGYHIVWAKSEMLAWVQKEKHCI